MKKFLLSAVALVIAGAFSASAAQTITEDWSAWEKFDLTDVTFPVTNVSATPNTTAPTGISYTFNGAYPNGGYIFINGKTYKDPAANVSFSLPFECSKIVVKTSNTCSENASSKINFLINNELQETVQVNVKNEEYTFNVPAGLGTTDKVFCFQSATSSYNQQFVSFTYYEVSDEPEVTINSNYNFAAGLNGKQEITIVPLIKNYTGTVTIATDNTQFTAPSSMSVAELAEGFTLTFNGTQAGTTSGTLTITAGTSVATANLNGYTASNAGTQSDPFSVADVLAMGNLNQGPFYVTGIINEKTAQNASNGVIGEAGAASDNNIILKDDKGNMIPVQLPAGEARTTLNIVDNPTNVGKTVVVKGTLESYFSVPGVKNTEYVSGLDSTGIDAIESQNMPVEYYNLQGVKVANPEKGGLYIIRQGNKSVKTVIR